MICILLSVGSNRDDRREFHIHRWYPFFAIKSLTLTNTSSKTGGRSGLGHPRYSNARSRYNGNRTAKHEQICSKFNYGKCKGDVCPDGRRHVPEHVARVAIEEAEAGINSKQQQNQEHDEKLDSLFQ